LTVTTQKRSNMMALDTEIMFLKICNQRQIFVLQLNIQTWLTY